MHVHLLAIGITIIISVVFSLSTNSAYADYFYRDVSTCHKNILLDGNLFVSLGTFFFFVFFLILMFFEFYICFEGMGRVRWAVTMKTDPNDVRRIVWTWGKLCFYLLIRFYLRFEGVERVRMDNDDKMGPNNVFRRLGHRYVFYFFFLMFLFC